MKIKLYKKLALVCIDSKIILEHVEKPWLVNSFRKIENFEFVTLLQTELQKHIGPGEALFGACVGFSRFFINLLMGLIINFFSSFHLSGELLYFLPLLL